MRFTIAMLALLSGAICAAPAAAQRTDDNAVTDAEDAFGRSIGGEQIGIYSPENVRGFSPVAAGNVRIDGLYFDQQAFVTDRVIESRTVHVGISALGYPFPAPTGIADNELRRPGKKMISSLGLSYGPFGGVGVELDSEIPLDSDRLGLILGLGRQSPVTEFGGTPEFYGLGLSLAYRPSANFSVQPFLGRIKIADDERPPLIFTSGAFLPPRIRRAKFFGQKWADFDAVAQNIGVISRANLGGFDLALGLFRSKLAVDNSFNDLLFETDEAGSVGRRLIVAEVDNEFASTSGELRVTRRLREGPRQHLLHLSLRGRAVDRRYGGAAVADLGASQIGVEDFRPEPELAFGAKSTDQVRQKTLGVGYELRWAKVGELGLGIQKTDYKKSVETPAGPLPASKDSPWLFSATAAAHLTGRLAIYGGYTRGLEESDVAPPDAVNRNEAPPALLTRQFDFGLRYAVRPGLSLILGYFDVEKPYFNLDGESRFRQLGTVRNRGAELSLAGQMAKGLTVVAGATYLDAAVSGEEVEAGLIGRRPVGTFRLRTLANVNWQLPWHEPLTLTARFESTSDRTANAANTLELPARWVAGLGARYRLDLGKVPVLVRLNVDNLFDTFGWNVGGSGFFTANGPRRYSLVVVADL